MIAAVNAAAEEAQSAASKSKVPSSQARFSTNVDAGPAHSSTAPLRSAASDPHVVPAAELAESNESTVFPESVAHPARAPEANGQESSSLFNQFVCMTQSCAVVLPRKSAPYTLIHTTLASSGVVAPVLVTDVVGVVVSVVVGVVVEDVVGVVVRVVVGLLVTVVVGVDVTVVVGVVVGVVTSQFWNPPAANASVMALIVSAVSEHALESNRSEPKTQPTFSLTPAGPRNSRIALFIADAVLPHSAEATVRDSNPGALSHITSAEAANEGLQAKSTSFKTCTCATHDCVASTKS